jgi:hypothetical protein
MEKDRMKNGQTGFLYLPALYSQLKDVGPSVHDHYQLTISFYTIYIVTLHAM